MATATRPRRRTAPLPLAALRAMARIEDALAAPAPFGAESLPEAEARIARIEGRMQDAADLREMAAAQGNDAAPAAAPVVAYPSYGAALEAGRKIGARRADDAALMALFCAGPLQTLVGAVSPELVWEGAQKRGLSVKQLGALANSDVMAVSELQWELT